MNNENSHTVSRSFEVASYKRFPFVIEKGSGSFVETDHGRRLLDLYGGHAVVGMGHCNPIVSQAIKDQLEDLVFYSNLAPIRIRSDAAKLLCELAPREHEWSSFFVNSGAEATENALKVARDYTGRDRIITFKGGFHGRTYAAHSASDLGGSGRAGGVMSQYTHAIFGDMNSVRDELAKGDVAAVFLEPIQSMAGIVEAESSFYVDLHKVCVEFGSLLIYDEVQTGVGRTGTPFYAGRHGVVPHMLTLGKSIANGIPMGAVLFRKSIGDTIQIGDLGSTFGGGPIACAAMKATLSLLDQDLMANAERMGDEIKQNISQLSFVKEVRGRGMLLGIEFANKEAKVYQTRLLENNIITGLAKNPMVLRLMPPLTLSDDELEIFMESFSLLGDL